MSVSQRRARRSVSTSLLVPLSSIVSLVAGAAWHRSIEGSAADASENARPQKQARGDVVGQQMLGQPRDSIASGGLRKYPL